MREIKFRAWDKNNCEFIFSEPFEHKREFAFVQFDIGFSGYDPNDLVIQQYTGLKDVDGVEIYEGDILKQRHSYVDTPEQDWIGTVEFCLQNYNGMLITGWNLKIKENLSFHIRDDAKIIGNIFETP